MKRKTTYALLFFCLAIACKKDSPTHTQLLSRNWIQTDITLTANGATQSVFAQQSVCDSDDIYGFKADGTLTITEGATKCNPSDPDIKGTGNWTLDANNTKLSITDNTNGAQTFTLEKLTSTDLVISDTATISGLLTKGTLYFKAH
jgi:uncharacterized protein affecting Mg2+/Co2+ transport